MNSRTRAIVASTATAVTVAVLARWLFCWLLFPVFLSDIGTVKDQYYFDSYREIAAQIIAGHGYRIAPDAIPCLHRPPGYVLILLASFPRSDLTSLWVHLLHGLLGGLATWLTVAMGRLWGLSRRGALAAGYGVALWPFLIWETKVTVPENLLVALLPAVFAALGRWRASGARGWLFLTGILAGVATLTHGYYQLLLPCLLVAILAVRRRPRRGPAAIVLSVVVLAVVMPWVVRNARIAGRPVGVASGFGMHYLKGLHNWRRLVAGEPYFRDHDPEAVAWVHQLLRDAGFDPSDDDFVRSDPAINRFLDARAWRDVRAHPGDLALRALVRAPLLWVQQQTPARSLATGALLLPFFLLAAVGVLRTRQREQGGLLVTLLVLNLAAAAVFPEAIPMRYALPLLPLLFFFSAQGLERLARASLDDHDESFRLKRAFKVTSTPRGGRSNSQGRNGVARASRDDREPSPDRGCPLNQKRIRGHGLPSLQGDPPTPQGQTCMRSDPQRIRAGGGPSQGHRLFALATLGTSPPLGAKLLAVTRPRSGLPPLASSRSVCHMVGASLT